MVGVEQCLAHRGVGVAVALIVGLAGFGGDVAAVELDVVDTPGREQVRVLLPVAEGTGEAAAGGGPGVLVDAELQSELMELLPDVGHSVREQGRVGDQVALGVALLGHPAVVDGDGVVPLLRQPGGHQGLGVAEDRLLVDPALVVRPVVPAHRRGGGIVGVLGHGTGRGGRRGGRGLGRERSGGHGGERGAAGDGSTEPSGKGGWHASTSRGLGGQGMVADAVSAEPFYGKLLVHDKMAAEAINNAHGSAEHGGCGCPYGSPRGARRSGAGQPSCGNRVGVDGASGDRTTRDEAPDVLLHSGVRMCWCAPSRTKPLSHRTRTVSCLPRSRSAAHSGSSAAISAASRSRLAAGMVCP